MNEQDAQIILAYATCNMNVNETSRQLYMHRNTVEYHLNKVKRITGLNPHHFYELYELTGIARNILEEFNLESNNK